MSHEHRQGYEFSKEIKKQIRRDQKQSCAVTGKRGYTEVHHLLGIALAKAYFPTVNPAIFHQKENGIALDPQVHKQLHEEMLLWPPEFTKLFVIGMYKYLRDLYHEKQQQVETNKTALGATKQRRIV
jgi:hypothetical protein